MGDGITVDILGNRALMAEMDAYVLDTIQQVQAILEEGGQMALETAQGLCPVDTGTLRDSLEVFTEPGEVTIGTGVEYAIYVELGTVKMPAQPFLQPAFDEAGPWIQERLVGF